MMIRRRFLALAPSAVAVSALAAGCRSPDPKLYTISAGPGQVLAGGPRAITLRAVSLARYLERQEIVRTSEDFRLDVQANDWWGEPLGAMIGRVLVEDLGQRLAGTQVFSESGAISPDSVERVEVNILRLDADHSGAVVLIAQVAVAPVSGEPTAHPVRLSVRPAGPSLADQVAATSQAVGLLADAIAREVAASGTAPPLAPRRSAGQTRR